LLLDPHCRTMEGFHTLVEKEWVHFGHMFCVRTDEGKLESSNPEWSPIFAQWLNILWCYLKKFPSAFEFEETVLEKLLENTYNPNLYSGTIMPNLWHGVHTPNGRQALKNHLFVKDSPLVWNCPTDTLWEPLYFKFSQPLVERKIKQRMRRNSSEDNFADIFSRFVADTVHLLQDMKEPKVVPQQYAAYMDFHIEGTEKAEDKDFWLRLAKEGRDKIAMNESFLHAHFEVTELGGKEGRRFQSCNLFKTREDAETSLDMEKQLIQEHGLTKHLVLEVQQIIPI